jgi:methyl-accepting chemotaxis protein
MSFSQIGKLSIKALILVIAVAVVSIVTTTGVLLGYFAQVLGPDRLRQNVMAAELLFNPDRAPYRVEAGKLYAGSRVLNDDETGVDGIASAFGGVATVFLGDTRIATNIKNDDGRRAVGTTLAPGTVYDRVLRDGKDYLGSAAILGKDYVTAYRPLKDASGATVGILFVGIEHGEFNKAFTHALVWGAVMALVLLALCGGAGAYVFLKLFAPLAPLSQAMEAVMAGRPVATVPFKDRDDEFGNLGRVIEKFAVVAQERESERAAIAKIVTCFSGALEALGRRDLTYRLTSDVPPEYKGLQANFNAALAQFEVAMKDIDGGATDIASNAAEIYSAARDMAARTEREAASLEETSAAVNQLLRAVEKSDEGAAQANHAAGEAQNRAVEGCDVAKDAIDAIRAIAQSSSEITQIIGVINDIAFQTNLLALNAGVEAARAGDAGRGFAVVASEVRGLAQRSAEAAKQIRDLIGKSESQVESGVRLVEESGRAFDKIVQEIATIYVLVTTIADSQREQTRALREIEGAVEALDRTTQQNAAMAEESCAACDTMAGHARDLTEEVQRFRTGQHRRLSHAA